jgi:nicotinamidase-related amidase
VLPATVALLLCDVWDDHWCSAAARRVDALAPRIDAVVAAARALGVLIVHAPSDTLAFYADWPQRRRALALPAIEPPAPLALPDPPLPIDDADGGCDSGEAPWRRAWSRQHPSIAIGPDDLIADDGRTVYAALAHHHRTVLCVAGVHTNMCVLNRSFGIKQMTRWGVRCLLLRDLTDAMYNPARPPRVSHDEGTALVIEHIERHWCPTLLGADLTRAAAGGRD